MKKIVLCDSGGNEKIVELCKKYNLSINLDSFSDISYLVNNPNGIEEQKNLNKEMDIFSLHGYFHDLCFGSKDILIKEVTMKRFNESYNISKDFNCKHIIFHNGYYPGTSYPPYWIERSKVFWKEFLKDKDMETIYYIENQFEDSPEILSELIEEVNDNRLKICLDIGHAFCNSKTSIENWIENLNSKIGFVHLHNNNGIVDEHLGLNNGKIDYKIVCELLEKYSKDIIWALEINLEDMEDSIKWLINNGYIK